MAERYHKFRKVTTFETAPISMQQVFAREGLSLYPRKKDLTNGPAVVEVSRYESKQRRRWVPIVKSTPMYDDSWMRQHRPKGKVPIKERSERSSWYEQKVYRAGNELTQKFLYESYTDVLNREEMSFAVPFDTALSYVCTQIESLRIQNNLVPFSIRPWHIVDGVEIDIKSKPIKILKNLSKLTQIFPVLVEAVSRYVIPSADGKNDIALESLDSSILDIVSDKKNIVAFEQFVHDAFYTARDNYFFYKQRKKLRLTME